MLTGSVWLLCSTPLRAGDIIQLERRGFFICDSNKEGSPIALIAVPDGKSVAPAGPAAPVAKAAAK